MSSDQYLIKPVSDRTAELDFINGSGLTTRCHLL